MEVVALPSPPSHLVDQDLCRVLLRKAAKKSEALFCTLKTVPLVPSECVITVHMMSRPEDVQYYYIGQAEVAVVSSLRTYMFRAIYMYTIN